MRCTCISSGWTFYRNGKNGEKVDLPHDMVVTLPRSPEADGGGCNGFWPSARGVYAKTLPPLQDAAAVLDVDGAYKLAEVRLNGQLLSQHPHGYTPWLTELTSAMWTDMENALRVQVTSPQPSTRWYSGGGIYRDVFLWTGGRVRILPGELFVYTEKADERSAEIAVSGCLTADTDARAEVKLTLLDPAGEAVCAGSVWVSARKEEAARFTHCLTVGMPKLWDTERPLLYTLRAEVFVSGDRTDTAEERFGIRTAQWDADRGFRLNGRELKLRGGCIHHDHGVLGSEAWAAAEERKVRLLKHAGFNALRIAHNPPSRALLDACDRLGVLVMDEAFDTWRDGKVAMDYHQWFESWWARDIEAMVKRHRNHPCVISWSIGNEINERNGSSDGAAWSMRLAEEIRKYDTTRPVTSAICGMWDQFLPEDTEEYRLRINHGTLTNHATASNDPADEWTELTEPYMSSLDIIGYNYLYHRWEQDHEKYPRRVIWGSETHAIHIYDSWEVVKKYPWATGDFTWTAFDNLGEAGTGRGCWARDGFIPGISVAGWPWRSCWQGDLDLCGYRRPQSYFREIVWGLRHAPYLVTTHPEHTGESYSGTGWHWYDVHETWTFDEAYLGRPVKVEAYSDAEEVEFLLNGRSLGRAKVEKCAAEMQIPYAPGTLEAVNLVGGRETGRCSLTTTGKPARILLRAESDRFAADGKDLGYVRITLADAEGRRVDACKAALRVSVSGARLRGVFSADPCNEDVYRSPECHAFDGRALAVLQADTAGEILVRVTADGIGESELRLTAF